MTSVEPKPNIVVQGHGIPVIMLHGMGLDYRGLLLLDDAFPEGIQRIYIDLPGHGRTPALPAPGGLQEMAVWTLNAVRDIVGEHPFALLGNSMGGAIARYILSQVPEQVCGIALIASVVDPVKSHRHVAQHVVSDPNPKLTEKLQSEQLIEFLQMGVNQSFEAWRRYQRYVLPGTKLYDHEAGLRLDSHYWLDEMPEQRLGTYQGPALIVTGKQDQVVGYEDHKMLLNYYPNAGYHVVDPAGHNIHIDQPEAVKELVGDWAAKLL